MKKLTKLLLAGLLTATSAFAGFGSGSKDTTTYLKSSKGVDHQYVICTASETGSYYKAGKRLVSLLGQDRDTGGNLAVAETTDGSKQNYELMTDKVCNVTFLQGDHAAYIRGVDKGFFDGKAVIETDRTENVQLIMRKGMDEDDLQSKSAKVLVGLANSGGAASWVNISHLETNYKKADVRYGDIDISALSDLASGRIDAIIRTSHLNPKTDDLANLVAKNKKIYFADLDDANLNNKINFGDGEKSIYRFVDTQVTTGFWAQEAETLETKVLIVVDKASMGKAQKNKILRVLTQNANNLF